MRTTSAVRSVTANPFRQMPVEILDTIILNFGPVKQAGRYTLANFMATERLLFKTGERHRCGVKWVVMMDVFLNRTSGCSHSAAERLEAALAQSQKIPDALLPPYLAQGVDTLIRNIDSFVRQFELMSQTSRQKCFEFICSNLQSLLPEDRIAPAGLLSGLVIQHPGKQFSTAALQAEIEKLPEHGKVAVACFEDIFRRSKSGYAGDINLQLIELLSELEGRQMMSESVRFALAAAALSQLHADIISSKLTEAVMKFGASVPEHEYALLLIFAREQEAAVNTNVVAFALKDRRATAEMLLKKRDRLNGDERSKLFPFIHSALMHFYRGPESTYAELVEFCVSIDRVNVQHHCATLLVSLADPRLADPLLVTASSGLDWFHRLLVRFVKDSSFDQDVSEVVQEARIHIEGLMKSASCNVNHADAFAALWTELWSTLCNRFDASRASKAAAEIPWEAAQPFTDALISTRPDSVAIEGVLQEAIKRLPEGHHAHFLRRVAEDLPFHYQYNFDLIENYCAALPVETQCEAWSMLVRDALSDPTHSKPAHRVVMWLWQTSCFKGPGRMKFLRAVIEGTYGLGRPERIWKLIFESSPELQAHQKAWLLYFMIECMLPSVWSGSAQATVDSRHATCAYLLKMISTIEGINQTPVPEWFSNAALRATMERAVKLWPREEADVIHRIQLKIEEQRQAVLARQAAHSKPEACSLQ